MRANLLRGQVGGGWALGIETFMGRVKGHQVVKQVPFGVQKNLDFLGPTPPTCTRNGFACIKIITYRAVSTRGPYCAEIKYMENAFLHLKASES
jgi:hypothetical protein